MAWLTLRNDHLLLDLCPELKNASFETLGAKVAELGLTLDFDIAAELARIEANKRRNSVKASARLALRQKIPKSELRHFVGFGRGFLLRMHRRSIFSAHQTAPSESNHEAAETRREHRPRI